MEQRYMKRSQVAKIYAIPDRMLDKLCHMKNGPAFKYHPTGNWYFDLEKLDKVLKGIQIGGRL